MKQRLSKDFDKTFWTKFDDKFPESKSKNTKLKAIQYGTVCAFIFSLLIVINVNRVKSKELYDVNAYVEYLIEYDKATSFESGSLSETNDPDSI